MKLVCFVFSSCPTCATTKCFVGSCTNFQVGCVFNPLLCSDSNSCTTDSCNTATGACVFNNISCTTGTCVTSVGCVPPSTSQCNVTTPCAALPCFTQKCVGGFCVPDVATVCNDNNACTTDSCSATAGCQYVSVTCSQSTSPCFASSCIPGPGTQPNCTLAAAAASCDDQNSCSVDTCDESLGCIHTNYSCSATNVACSFPNGCIGTGVIPDCLIANYSCALNAAQIAGISAGVVAGVVVGAVIAALLAVFASKKGYDYYQAKSATGSTGLQYNPAFTPSQNTGTMA
jgi:hypothetical protein